MNRRLYIRGGIMAFAAWLTLSGCGGVAQTSLVEDSASTVTVTVQPAAPQLSVRATQRFASTVTGAADTAVSWEVAEAAGGTIDASGQYQAPGAPGTYHVVATSLADPTAKSTATVTVAAVQVVAVTVSPKTASITTSGSVQLSAAVSGTSNSAVNWSVAQGASGGTVSAGGLYRPAGAGVFQVVATSAADNTKSDSATVTVTAPAQVVAVTVSPRTASITTSGSVQLSAAVSGTSNSVVNWSIAQGASGGTVSAGGLYRPAGAGVFQVVATSAADNTKSDSATVTVTAPAGTDLASQLAVLAGHAIFFDHASVGENLMDGVRALLPTVSGPKPTVVNMDGGLKLNATTGEWAEATHLAGLNGDPRGKFQRFLTDLDVVAGSGSKVDIAFLKMCFVDFTSATHGTANVASLFAAYQAMVTSAKAAHPGIHFVHLTPPLETSANGAWNVDRDAFGTLLKNAYGADVFDLQLYESTNPDGSRSTSGGVPALAGAYTNDSGHLNSTGQAQVVPQLVKFLANLQ